jgi:hypothetical protein
MPENWPKLKNSTYWLPVESLQRVSTNFRTKRKIVLRGGEADVATSFEKNVARDEAAELRGETVPVLRTLSNIQAQHK